jgi:opacity protein-like surface antigen
MKPVPAVFLACTLLLAAAVPAAAQRIDSPYRFLDHGQHVGVYAGHVSAGAGRLELGPQPAQLFGARWALRVSGPFSVGAEVGYMPTTRTVRDTVFVAADSMFRTVGETNMNLLSLMANLHFSITGPRTWHMLRPFATLGGGAVMDLAGAAPEEAEMAAGMRYDFGTSFAGHFGAGVEWFPSQRVSVRLDARNMLWKLGIPEAFLLTEAGRNTPRSEWENNFALLAGLSFHF